jgi:spermidine synthase
MVTLPVLAVLVCDLLLFLGGLRRFRADSRQKDGIFLCVLFFCSGMPALIYQVVWQRALFSLYGVNAESVAVIVSAFMLGLGLGSLLGGWASSRFPEKLVSLFAVSELGVGIFGLFSLRMFHWAAAFSAGKSLPTTVLFGLLLLLFPTMLMGATLPLLVQQFVRGSERVGFSVSMLYFVNTFGSAVACYFCATFLLRDFGEWHAVLVAASMNAMVSVTAFVFGRYLATDELRAAPTPSVGSDAKTIESNLPLGMAMLIAGLAGFISLGFEILWFRVFLLASQDRAPAFALLLSTFLAGVAAGSYVSEIRTTKKGPEQVLRTVGALLLTSGAVSVYLPPLVALFRWKGLQLMQLGTPVMQSQWQGMWHLLTVPAFFITTALISSVMPLVCRLAVKPGRATGSGVSWTYASNIFGSTLGSLLIGFFWMNHFGLQRVAVDLGLAAVFTGLLVLFFSRGKWSIPPRRTLALGVASIAAIAVSGPAYSRFFEKLILGPGDRVRGPFVRSIENRNGVIEISRDATVYGNGVYDGSFSVDPTNDVNYIIRVYALSLFHPAPKRILMIGLSSGSWAQVLVNHPQVESLDIIEINPGYVALIPQYPVVASLLQNPRAHIYVDDGRRWLRAHPSEKYDAILMNTSFYWRDHSSVLLSADFLELVRRHLNKGGVFYYNTTGSEDVINTGLHVFPYGLRVYNALAVSDSPIILDEDRWMQKLRQYKIDGRPVFDPLEPRSAQTLADYAALVRNVDTSTKTESIETSKSMNPRLANRMIITDDNMGLEWRAR